MLHSFAVIAFLLALTACHRQSAEPHSDPAPPGTLRILSPLASQIVQRGDSGEATVRIQAELSGTADEIWARVVDQTDWQRLSAGSFSDQLVQAQLQLAGGWHDLEVAAGRQGIRGDAARVTFGVGEIFITAGQSNSSDFGFPRQSSLSNRVLAFDGNAWIAANDIIPEPQVQDLLAYSRDWSTWGGSPWPHLGDLLTGRLNVPIGFVMVGWPGTSIAQWQFGQGVLSYLPLAGGPAQALPAGFLYSRLADALRSFGPRGVRAVLWHQGESDASKGTSTATYTQLLQALIARSREDAGWAVPWGIATATYYGDNVIAACKGDAVCLKAIADKQAAVVLAQHAVAAESPNFAGADTDPLTGPSWRHDGIHLNQAGLDRHAELWRAALAAALFP
jgi:hypothetical protein